MREETRCRHMGYSFRLTARVLLYAPSHRQDNTYHGLCYTSRGALAGTRNSSMGPPHDGSIRRPSHHERTLLPWSYISLSKVKDEMLYITSMHTNTLTNTSIHPLVCSSIYSFVCTHTHTHVRTRAYKTPYTQKMVGYTYMQTQIHIGETILLLDLKQVRLQAFETRSKQSFFF